LVDLARRWTGEDIAPPPERWDRLRANVRDRVRSLSEDQLEAVARSAISEAAAAYGSVRPVLDRYSTYLRSKWVASDAVVELKAFEGLSVGGPIHRGRAAANFVRLAKRANGPVRWARLSDAADALEGWLYGQGPLVRRRTGRIHLAAARATGGGWYWFRAARSARARGDWDDTERLLMRALAADLQTDQAAHCHRMLALTKAARGEDYDDDIRRAADLFEFSSRTLARADLVRTRAGCELLRGRGDAALASFLEASMAHARFGQRTGLVQSLIGAVLTLISPRLAARFAGRV
jgi:hypothetical protein